jgi:tubulin---tyrosine ligase
MWSFYFVEFFFEMIVSASRVNLAVSHEKKGGSRRNSNKIFKPSFFVGPGNNSALIKRLMKARGWQTSGTSDSSFSFVWTQFRLQSFLDAKATERKYQLQFGADRGVKSKILPGSDTTMRIHNHFEGVGCMCTKRGLIESLISTNSIHIMPKSWIFKKSDPRDIENDFAKSQEGILIVKPGEFTNRGTGIKVVKSSEEAVSAIRACNAPSVVVQRYICNPLLFDGRKFDIRSYGLICSDDGTEFSSYFYPEVYVRTTSEPYSLADLNNRFVHLNNDAVQKHAKNYGKHEQANKLTLEQLVKKTKKNVVTPESITAKIRDYTKIVFDSCKSNLNPRKIRHCFEVVGFDWMIDETGEVFLIEANTNPCLELVCNYLSTLIPDMIEGAFQLTVDSWSGSKAVEGMKNKWIPY